MRSSVTGVRRWKLLVVVMSCRKVVVRLKESDDIHRVRARGVFDFWRAATTSIVVVRVDFAFPSGTHLLLHHIHHGIVSIYFLDSHLQLIMELTPTAARSNPHTTMRRCGHRLLSSEPERPTSSRTPSLARPLLLRLLESVCPLVYPLATLSDWS